MPLINREVELKLKQTKNCVLAADGNDNDVTFTMKNTKLFFSVVIL